MAVHVQPEEIEAAQAPQLAQPAAEGSEADAASSSHQQPAAQQPGPAAPDESMPGSSGAQQQADGHAGGEGSNGTPHNDGPNGAGNSKLT